ncbi:Pol [Chelydra serpentina]|uniref:Pol n=1 Tax=Chelydra serpentina TaxID=8475 RepID=A0A8T1S9X8_CHESE|nr:Pol [Chelydra serpentina]
MCKKLGIQRSFTSPYHPQTNGLTENTNKSIKRALRKLVDDSATNWDEFLGDIVFSLRRKPKMTTKLSPYRLLYGFEARVPDQVSDNYTPTDFEELNEEYYKEYIMKIEARRDAETKLAISNISKAQEKQQIQYAKTKTGKHGEITFKVNNIQLSCY